MIQKSSSSIQKNPSKISIRVFLIANSIIIGLLTIWLILGNLLATQKETEIRSELAKFARRFPKAASNSTAIKLDKLVTKLGLSMHTDDYSLPSKIDRTSFEGIRKPLNSYLTAQTIRPSDHVDVPPESVQKYLTVHTVDLANIRNHVLNSEAPRWENYDFQKIVQNRLDTDITPSQLISLQKILLADALEANRLGQSQRTLDSLEVSWKLIQSFHERPQLVPVLISIIASNLQTGVLRKIKDLPPKWKQPLIPNVRKSLLTAAKGESFISFESLRAYSFEEDDFWQSINSVYQDITYEDTNNFGKSPLAKIQQVFQQPYFRLAGATQWSKRSGTISKLSDQDVCALDDQVWGDKNQDVWWLSFDKHSMAILPQLRKADRSLIDQELTGKVIQIKEIIAKSGQSPQTIPGIESSKVCQSLRWKYQVSTDGTISISLQNPPKWLVLKESYLPLNYQLNSQDLLKYSSSKK